MMFHCYLDADILNDNQDIDYIDCNNPMNRVLDDSVGLCEALSTN